MKPGPIILGIPLMMFLCSGEHVVNLAIFITLTDRVTNISESRVAYHPARYIPTLASAIRALHDVNNNDGRILAELANRTNPCHITYKYHIVDTISASGSAIQQYFFLDGNLRTKGQKIDAIIGPGRSAEATGLSTIATVYKIPIVSFSATSAELDDKVKYPTFMRTVPSDDSIAEAIANFLLHYDYHEANLIYVEDDYGKAYRDVLLRRCGELSIVLNAFPHSRGGTASIKNAVHGMKERNLNIYIAVIFLEDLRVLVNEAQALNMTGQGRLWIFSDAIGSSTALQSVTSANVSNALEFRRAMNGTTQIAVSNTANSIIGGKNYLREFSQLMNVDELNAHLPGGQFGSDFENYSYPQRIMSTFFSQVQPQVFSVFAYDAAVAITRGIDSLCTQGELEDIDGNSIRQMGLEFMGVTGDPVRLLNATGARDPCTIQFEAHNTLVDVAGNVQLQRSKAVWTAKEVSWNVSHDFYFAGGTKEVPLLTDPVDENQNVISTSTRIWVFSVNGVLELTCLLFLIWVIAHKNYPVLSASQPIFLDLMLIGIMLFTSAVFLMGWDDTKLKVQTLNIFCNAQLWVLSLGLTLAVSSLLVKLYRIYRLFSSTYSFRKVTIKVDHLLIVVLCAVIADLVLLTICTTINPITFTREIKMVDRFDQALESYGFCKSEGYLFILLICFHMLLYIAGAVLVYKARNFPSDFQEAKWLSVAVFSQSQLLLIAIPILLSIDLSDTTLYFICFGMSIFVFSTVQVMLIFVPKFLRFYYGEKYVKTTSRREMKETGERLDQFASTYGYSSNTGGSGFRQESATLQTGPLGNTENSKFESK